VSELEDYSSSMMMTTLSMLDVEFSLRMRAHSQQRGEKVVSRQLLVGNCLSQ